MNHHPDSIGKGESKFAREIDGNVLDRSGRM